MDCLHIIPAKGLSGYFYLDMSLPKAIKKLRTFSAKLPSINIIEESSTKRAILDIPDSRVRLIFDELYQLLLIIEIDCRESSVPHLPIMLQSKMYTDYSDIQKAFETSSYKQLQITESEIIEQYSGISTLLGTGKLLKLFIHKTSTIPLHRNPIKVRIYEVRVLDKIVIRHSTGKTEDLKWGIFPEAAFEIMGPPDFVRYKSKGNYNFFSYVFSSEGLDFLFDCEKSALVKIVLHTNMMEDIMFNEYQRCNYIVYTEKGEINPLTRFEEIKELFDCSPVEVGIRRHSHGFRPTQYFKFPGIVFEVLYTGYVSSIALTQL